MFRRAANLLSSVADAIDDMLAADFEYEVDDHVPLAVGSRAAYGRLECRRAEWPAATEWIEEFMGPAGEPLSSTATVPGSIAEGPGCDGASRWRRAATELPVSSQRRAGSVPRPVEVCLTPIEQRPPRRDSGSTGIR